MNAKYSFVIIATIIILLSGCGATKVDMNQPAADGQFHYANDDLGFSLSLPPELIYFQTQRINDRDLQYSDIQIFVPTSDPAYTSEPVNYANPVTIRTANKDFWDKEKNAAVNTGFSAIGKNFQKVYLIKYWNRVPTDWKDKWTDLMKLNIVGGFKIK